MMIRLRATVNSVGRLTRAEFRPAFDWVARELTLPDANRDAIFEAVHASLYDGLERRLKAIYAVWPEGGQWPTGHTYLQESSRQELEEDDEWQEGDDLPQVSQRELIKLLLIRFTHVAQRLYRNRQVRDFYKDDLLRKRHPFIEMNRNACEENALCGRESKVQLSVDEGLRLMEELVCSHPACRCTFDPSKGT